MVPARSPSWSCPGQACEQDWNWAQLWGHEGALPALCVTHLSLLTPVGFAYPIVFLCQLSASAWPDSSGGTMGWLWDPTDPQQDSAWHFVGMRAKGNHQSSWAWERQTEISPCFQNIFHQQEKVTSFRFFQPNDHSLFCSIPAPPVLTCVTCPWHWHLAPTLILHIPTPPNLTPGCVCLPHEPTVVFRAMFGFQHHFLLTLQGEHRQVSSHSVQNRFFFSSCKHRCKPFLLLLFIVFIKKGC